MGNCKIQCMQYLEKDWSQTTTWSSGLGWGWEVFSLYRVLLAIKCSTRSVCHSVHLRFLATLYLLVNNFLEYKCSINLKIVIIAHGTNLILTSESQK